MSLAIALVLLTVGATFVDYDLVRDSIWRQCFAKEPCSSWTIPALSQHKIKSVSSFADSTIEINPFAANTNISFIHAPWIQRWTLFECARAATTSQPTYSVLRGQLAYRVQQSPISNHDRTSCTADRSKQRKKLHPSGNGSFSMRSRLKLFEKYSTRTDLRSRRLVNSTPEITTHHERPVMHWQ